MADEALREMERGILGDIWTTNEPYETLRRLCDEVGHRYAGSPSEKAGAQFLKAKMEEYGLQNVRLEEFPVAGWERGSAALALVEPVQRDFSCVAMPYCPSADITAELLDVGEGELADFERLGEQVRGKVVISAAETQQGRRTQEPPHRQVRLGRSERGALAYIYINQNPGLLHITGSITGRNPKGGSAADREAPIPGVGVSLRGRLGHPAADATQRRQRQSPPASSPTAPSTAPARTSSARSSALSIPTRSC